jgi:hypothetical protein
MSRRSHGHAGCALQVVACEDTHKRLAKTARGRMHAAAALSMAIARCLYLNLSQPSSPQFLRKRFLLPDFDL